MLTVRELFGRVRILFEFPFRVDPSRCTASIALLVLSQLAAVGSALALGVVTNAVIKDEPSRAVVGSALLVARSSSHRPGAGHRSSSGRP